MEMNVPSGYSENDRIRSSKLTEIAQHIKMERRLSVGSAGARVTYGQLD
jgi:hypothetical protein